MNHYVPLITKGRFEGYHRKQFFVGKGNFLFFRIEVKTEEGSIQKGWARVGGYFFGPLSEEVEVIWD